MRRGDPRGAGRGSRPVARRGRGTARLNRAVIVGARPDGSAKVVLDILRLMGGWEVVGFLDDVRALWGTRVGGVEVLGGTERLDRLAAEGVGHAAFAVGSNRAREAILRRAVAAGITPVNAIHPRATVAADVALGRGIWMAAGAVVNPGSRVGDGAIINTGATVDHDNVIGDYANISPGCHLSGRTRVGRYAFLGTGAVTLPDVSIGVDAVVGAAAVVLRDVPDGVTVAGVPARVLKPRDPSGRDPAPPST